MDSISREVKLRREKARFEPGQRRDGAEITEAVKGFFRDAVDNEIEADHAGEETVAKSPTPLALAAPRRTLSTEPNRARFYAQCEEPGCEWFGRLLHQTGAYKTDEEQERALRDCETKAQAHMEVHKHATTVRFDIVGQIAAVYEPESVDDVRR